MPFELLSSFLTGIPHLDEEHQSLLARINSIEELEQAGDTERLLGRLETFMSALTEHFSIEETHLKSLHYPKLSSHARHHTETLVALDRLIRDIKNGEDIKPSVAGYCFHELISAVLMTDMEFVNWLADKATHKA